MSDTYSAPAVLAAEQYRRAADMAERAKADLLEAAVRERSMVKLSGLAKTAGIEESTLRKWIKRNGENHGS